MILQLREVRVTLQGFEILRGVNLHIGPGEAVALWGRNGAGKTTTLRAIMGLVALKAGQILLDGAHLENIPTHSRAALGLGYAPEDRRLIGHLTVEDNLLLPAWALRLSSGEARRRLEEVYALLPELQRLKGRLAAALSGGEGKMVALGRALMVGTRVVLLDEPFQGLAPALAQRYAETLVRVRQEKREVAFLVTESNPKLVKGLADRSYHIERGFVEEVNEDRSRSPF
ncbi:ABC transporter ATP-binding protein [Thermus tengchongensis]|uniref:ABC transporter ATP-binding protein n=1 Tax=Thermus tengchongensis TaxID=1214928 RepID=UPI00191BCBBA|nr:ATP-binding cassette domain-containing protein [Thermus tengchongensis]